MSIKKIIGLVFVLMLAVLALTSYQHNESVKAEVAKAEAAKQAEAAEFKARQEQEAKDRQALYKALGKL